MAQQDMQSSIQKNAIILGLFAAITVTLVALIYQGTQPRIAQAQRQAQMDALMQILPAHAHNGNLFDNTIEVEDPLLGNRTPSTAYIATLDGQPTAIILQATAPDGYSGDISLIIGIMADGQLAGVRVLQHKETPGLGDKIELDKNPWIKSFDGKSLRNPLPERWGVKKDRGNFDQFAGATITPRAVVKAVQRALMFFDAQHQQLFTQVVEKTTAEATP